MRFSLLPLMIYTMAGTMIWATAKYAEMQDRFRLHRATQPRCRPVVSRPLRR